MSRNDHFDAGAHLERRMDELQSMPLRASHGARIVIARSTGPLDHLADHEVQETEFMSQHGRGGEYDASRKLIRVHPDHLFGVDIHGQNPLIHEVGHAHSAALGQASAQYDTPHRQAAEEHYAVQFARRHSRSGPAVR